jgi:hypothetical protein
MAKGGEKAKTVRIRDSKNLKCDMHPRRPGPSEGLDHVEPEFCILEGFSRMDDKIQLSFKNGCQTQIRAGNMDGGREIDVLGEKLGSWLGRSYEDILNTNI